MIGQTTCFSTTGGRGFFWTDPLSKHNQFPFGTFELTRKGESKDLLA